MNVKTEDVAKDFMDALHRLRVGAPLVLTVPTKGVPIPISISAVAKEAGRSRTLIGMDDCAYPKVRAAVLQAMKGETAVVDEESEPTPSETIDALKRENRRLTGMITDLASRLAASDDVVSQLRKALAREEARSSRNRNSLHP